MSTHEHADQRANAAPTKKTANAPKVVNASGSLLQRMEYAPQTIRPADILHLQRAIGNRATERLLQTRLKLGPTSPRPSGRADQVAQRADQDEEELQAKPLAAGISQVQRAETTPDRPQWVNRYAGVSFTTPESRPAKQAFVASLPTPKVQRAEQDEDELQAKPLAGGAAGKQAFLPSPPTPKVQREEMDEEMLQAAANHGLEGGDVDADVARSIQSAKGGGAPLHDGVRSSMEGAFGADFSGVNVHTGPQADALNRSLNARAFTTGNDIFFGQGQYNPGSTGGQELIAHELTHTVQQGAAGVQRSAPGDSIQRQPGAAVLIQRAPNLVRLEQGLGKNKYKKVVAAEQTEYFDKLSDDQLDRYKRMKNDDFIVLVDGLKETLLGSLAGKTITISQISDLLGAVVETGEEASTIVKMMPSILGSLSGVVSAGTDTVMEGFGGGIGGIKDTIEGGSSVVKQQKYLEGGLTTLGGLSGLASLIPGVPDVVGMAGAGAKSAGGIAKMSNVWINQSAIKKLRSDGSANTALGAALDVLDAKLDHWSYIEGAMQTGLGAVEGVGAMYGSVTKWTAGAISKGTETAYNWLPYIGRALGSYTGLVDSNTTVKEKEEAGKTEGKKKMWAAVESVESGGLPEHIGRLHRLAVLIEPDYATEINHAVGTLGRTLRESVEKAIKLKATWNPS